MNSYRQNPPPVLQLVQHDAALLRLNRVYRLAAGEAARKPDHALRQPDLSQLLVLLLAQLLVLCIIAAEFRACLGRLCVVEDDLLVERLVRVAQRRVVDGEEAERRGYYAHWVAHLVSSE